MRALRDKKGMFAHLIIIASVAALFGTSAVAQPGPASRRKPMAPSADSDIHHVVPQKCVPAQGQFVWNFEEEELINVLRQVSDMLCWNIVMTDTINKNMKMTIIGKSPLTKTDARDVLMAALAAKGLALIEQGKTWTVIKRAESKNFSTPFYSDALNVANNESVGTLFYKAEHATPDALRNIAKMLISKDGIVEPVGEQFLIVIDSNSNIKRLGRIFSQIDVDDAVNKIHVIKLQHADVKSVEKQVRELFDVAGGTGGPRGRRRPGEEGGKSGLNIKKVIADDRTNSLIVEADEDTFQKLLEIVKSTLDLPISDMSNKGKIHVYRMRHGDAKKVSETLNNVVKPGGSRGRGRFPRRDEESSELFEGEVQVTAHESSNMIVIVASQNDYNSLLPTIMKLDIRRDQVYIEAAIMDIEVNDKNEFGINLFGGMGDTAGNIGFLGNPGGNKMVGDLATKAAAAATAGTSLGLTGNQSALGALAVLTNFANGGVLGLVGKAIGDTKLPSFGAVLQALSTNSNVDILSTPYLLTSDNEQAVMKVGQKVPTVKGTSNAGGGLGLSVPLQNVSYEPVELSFKVTPHVGADNNVRLDIEQEVNELGAEVNLLSGPQKIIQTKSTKTTIVLKDQQTGVIGGLMHNKTTKNDTKIPFLGDIPLLGWLFKTRNTDAQKKSLLLIITPYVIKTDEDYRKIVDKKFKEREEFAAMYFGGKIKTYNPYVDYDKKSGPVSSLLLAIDIEMNRPENGGPGDGTETFIKPKEKASDSIQVVPIISAETVLLQKDFEGDDSETVAEEDLFDLDSTPVSPAPFVDDRSNAVAEQGLIKTESAPVSPPAFVGGGSDAVAEQDLIKSESAPVSPPAFVGGGSEAVAEQDLFKSESVPVSPPSIELDE